MVILVAKIHAAWFSILRASKWAIRTVPGRATVRYTLMMANYIEANRPDAIFANLPRAEAAALPACHSLAQEVPVLPVIHENPRYRRRRYRLRLASLCPRAGHILLCQTVLRKPSQKCPESPEMQSPRFITRCKYIELVRTPGMRPDMIGSIFEAPRSSCRRTDSRNKRTFLRSSAHSAGFGKGTPAD